VLSILLVEWSIYGAIRAQAVRDESRPADAIVIFGAAEYNGAPSPVFRARLDHAFELEERGLAPLIITTGGRGGERTFTEAGVGRDYLVQRGMDRARILAETRSGTSFESVRAAVQLLKMRHARTCIAVSDGFHLFRLKLMFTHEGVAAYASPDPDSPIETDPLKRTLHTFREMLSTSLWYLGYRG
jgi:uncharacterized SAM-binding protein YcdF (DUF218 family)